MRPLKTNEEAFGMGNNLTGGNSLVPAVQELWNAWEIHCLILLSLSLQAFLFLFADMRRRSSSRVLRTFLWLAYLAADFVAIFVLGHLAVHAGQPRHQLMSFWAPFVLVHLGGQDTITAFSREDNELWKRHLLGLVTQVSVAGYVVMKASWPDVRLRAAMVLIFISGCFRYAERTYCLYRSSPAKLRSEALSRLSYYEALHQANSIVSSTYDNIWKGGGFQGLSLLFKQFHFITSDLMSGDVPNNQVLEGYHLESILQQFLANPGRCRVYEHVGALLVHAYQTLYTKIPFRKFLYIDFHYDFYSDLADSFSEFPLTTVVLYSICLICYIIFLLYLLLQFASAPIALVLFWAAQKGHQDQLQTNPADITVSYILLIGAIALDVSATISMFPSYYQVPSARCNKKHWSEKLGQYNIISRHIGLPEVTHTPMISKDDGDKGSPSPIKEFILDKLLGFGARKQWNIASFRGRWVIQEWMDKHGIPYSERPRKALVKTTSDDITDFPTSVLIWHIATKICYFHCDSTDNAASSTSPDDDRQQHTKKHKQISRELSNYIMYLIFKRRVMLTTNSQKVHDIAHEVVHDRARSVYEAHVITTGKKKIEINDFIIKFFDVTAIRNVNAPANNPRLKVHHNAGTLLPRASELAQELIRISNEKDRWELIASVWAEMAYYTAPRCGAAFHYEHLSTGGEFITHLLVLMYILGPFLPDPDVVCAIV